jgi:hypothetical protein
LGGQYNAPLYGRFTAHLHLKPLPFVATAEFLPRYPAAERVAVYAILGGIPAYLERFDGSLTLADNVKRHIFRPTGIFRIPICTSFSASSSPTVTAQASATPSVETGG